MVSKIFEFIGKLLSSLKELPIPVSYIYVPPRRQTLPRELSSYISPHVKPDTWFYESLLIIENLSNKVLKDIRIIIPTEIKYNSSVIASDSMKNPDWTYNARKSEIHIECIEPKQILYVTIYPVENRIKYFKKPDVIISDQLHTVSMNIYAFVKSNPKSFFFLSLLFVVLIIGLLVFIYKTDKESQKLSLINEAIRPYSGCPLTVLHGDEINRDNIINNKLGLPAILKFNKVSTLDELYEKKSVIVCK